MFFFGCSFYVLGNTYISARCACAGAYIKLSFGGGKERGHFRVYLSGGHGIYCSPLWTKSKRGNGEWSGERGAEKWVAG